MFWWPVIIIAAAILVLLFTGSPPEISEEFDMRAVYLAVLATALLLFAAGGVLVRGGHRAMVNIAICVGTVAGLSTAFVFREEAAFLVTEIRGELMPTVALSRAVGVEELRRDWDGHYRAKVKINGVSLELMVDTGASMVMIPYEDAVSIGIEPETLEFSVPVTTANGHSEVAPVRLGSIEIGQIEVHDVPAAVARPGRLKTGLLGLSFLERLDETSFQKDRLYLRQRIVIEEAGARQAPFQP